MNDEYVNEVSIRLRRMTFRFMALVIAFILSWALLWLSDRIPYGNYVGFASVLVTGTALVSLGRAIASVNDILLL